MQRRLIFKLRDDLDTDSILVITNLFKVPKDYSSSWSSFTEKKSQVDNKLVNKEVDSFIGLLNEAKVQFGAEPVYLFFHTPTDTFTKLKDSLAKIKEDKANLKLLTKEDSKYEMPVFHFTFGSEVPRGFSESNLEDILNQFKKYLPQGGTSGGASAHLLDFAYIKYENIPTAAEYQPNAKGNQDYFDSIEILELPDQIDEKAEKSMASDETWVGIVEKWGWNTAHKAFGDINGRIKLVRGLTGKLLRKLLSNQHSSDDESHGTKTLGILISQAQSTTGKGLRAILPPKVKIALSSCIVELDQGAKTLYDAQGFNEESALSNLIDHFFFLKLSNQVILVELATYEGFPITTEPMIAQLVELASHLGHTVVIPAGNRINTENIDGLAALKLNAPYLLVGAYEPKGIRKLLVRDSTNWGKKNVKIFAQGSDVLTTHNARRVERLDHLGIADDSLFDSMGYTSAASAIVAGVVGRLQSYARSRKPKGRALFPSEMMKILEKSKGMSVFKGNKKVGNSINVKEAKEQINILLGE